MGYISGTFEVDGLPRNGATARLYSAGAFSPSPPIQGQALPVTAAISSVTTGTAFGHAGAYWFSVSTGSYVVAITWNGANYYHLHEGGATTTASVKAYGAVGDGVTDDTNAITAALADTALGLLYFPPGTYLTTGNSIANRTGLIIEGQGATIKLTGAGTSGNPRGALTPTGTCRDITIRNLRFLGSGTASDYHAGVEVGTGVTLERLTIQDCHFESLALGVWINSVSGVMVDFLITSCRFEEMVGVGNGQGRGIYCSYTPAFPLNFTVRDCDFETCSLYGVQISEADNVSIRDCTFQNHRSTTSTGAVTPAVLIRDGENIEITGNRFTDTSDGCIGLIPAGTEIRRVGIRDNTFDGLVNAIQAITVGSQDPASDGSVEHLLVSGNFLYQTAQTCPFLVLYAGRKVQIRGNRGLIENLAGTTYAVDLAGCGESGTTANYTQDVRIEGNDVRFTLSGGAGYGIRMREDVAPTPDQRFCTSSIRAWFSGNDFPGATAHFSVQASVTDDNLRVLEVDTSGLTFDSTSYPVEADVYGLDVASWIRLGGRKRVAADTTLQGHETVCLVTAGASDRTITLPAIASLPTVTNAGDAHLFVVVKVDTGVGKVGIAATGLDTLLASSAGVRLQQPYSAVLLLADNTEKRWHVIGKLGLPDLYSYRSIANTDSPYTLATTDDLVYIDSSAGNVTVNLPALATVQGRRFRFLRTSTSNVVTLDGSGAETIIGAATYVLPNSATYNWVEVQATPSDWKVSGGRF